MSKSFLVLFFKKERFLLQYLVSNGHLKRARPTTATADAHKAAALPGITRQPTVPFR
jgi:hypothetical protein